MDLASRKNPDVNPKESASANENSSDSSDDETDGSITTKKQIRIYDSSSSEETEGTAISEEQSLPRHSRNDDSQYGYTSDDEKNKGSPQKTEKENNSNDLLDNSCVTPSKNVDIKSLCGKEMSSGKVCKSSDDVSSGDCSDFDEGRKRAVQKKRVQSDISDSEGSTSEFNSLKIKKRKRELKENRNEMEIKEKEICKKDDLKIEKLKRYLRVAGLRVKSYKSLWENCKTKKAKYEKMMQMLIDAGLKGKPTLQKCKKLQAKRQWKEELKSLDVGNIIASDQGRPKRSACGFINQSRNSFEEKSLKERNDSTFEQLKALVDSEGSD